MRALDHAQSALQKATSCAADADERSRCAYEKTAQHETELAEVYAELEAKSELEAVRLRLADAENGRAKDITEPDALRGLNVSRLDNMEEDKFTRRIMERMRAMETKNTSLRWNKKSFEMIVCRNEG